MRLSLKANITKTEADTLDKILKSAGFHNRTEYLTALIQQTIYADNTIRTTTIQALDQIAFPVIAMRGGKTALRTSITEKHTITEYLRLKNAITTLIETRTREHQHTPARP